MYKICITIFSLFWPVMINIIIYLIFDRIYKKKHKQLNKAWFNCGLHEGSNRVFSATRPELMIKEKSFEEYYEEVTKKKTNDKSISNNN